MIGLALAVLLALLAVDVTSAQEPSRQALEALRQRGLSGAVATVTGRVYMEGRRPSDPDAPLAGLGVLIVPRSPDLMEQLEAVKRGARESVDGFRAAAPTTHAAFIDYETELWQSGFPDAAIRVVTDDRGAFRATVPAGAWIVFVERSVFVSLHAPRDQPPPNANALDPLARYSTAQYQHFHKIARLSGFDAVAIWLRDVDAEAGQSVALELHDRGVWLSGVVEETDTPRRMRAMGRGKRR